MFVRGADKVIIGSYGQKKTPVAGKNYIAVHDDIEGLDDVINESSVHEAAFDSSFNFNHFGDMSLPLKAFSLGIDDEFAYKMLIQGHCTFKLMHIRTGDLEKKINRRPRLIEELREFPRLRLVTSVIHLESCVLKSSKDHDFSVVGDLDVGIGGGEGGDAPKGKGKGFKRPEDAPFTLSVDGDDSGGDERRLHFKYGPGSVFAYALHKPKWDKKNKNKRTRITGWEDDFQGVN